MPKNFEQQINYIEAENNEDREKKLHEEMLKIQINYADHVLEDFNGKTFADVLDKINSRVLMQLKKIFLLQIHRFSNQNIYQFYEDKFLQKCSDDLNNLYINAKNNNSDIANPILDYLQKTEDEIREKFPENQDSEQNKNDDKKIGLLRYENRATEEIKKELIQKKNFNELDEFMSIHLDAGFKNDRGIRDIKKWLEILAEKIVDEYPETRAITGSSWLLDRESIRDFLGFSVLYESEEINWAQFLDENGQINKEKIQQLFENKQPPMKNIVAYETTKDFLEKFLPQHRRNQEITLKKINPDYKPKYEIHEIKEYSKNFVNDWNDGVIESRNDLNQFFITYITLKNFLVDAHCFDDLINLFSKNFGKTVEEIKKDNKNEIEIITKKMDEYSKKVENQKYIDEKIFIKSK